MENLHKVTSVYAPEKLETESASNKEKGLSESQCSLLVEYYSTIKKCSLGKLP